MSEISELLTLICSHNPPQSKCFYPSGPCAAGHGRSVMGMSPEGTFCTGRSAYVASAPLVRLPRPALQDRSNMHRALSTAVEALCAVAGRKYNDPADRYTIFLDTLKNIRENYVGDLRLTSMAVSCAWCQKSLGTKEGDGAVGPTSSICPSCSDKVLAASAAAPQEPTASVEITRSIEEISAFQGVQAAFTQVAPAEQEPPLASRDYNYFKCVLTGIRNTMRRSDDPKDHAATEHMNFF